MATFDDITNNPVRARQMGATGRMASAMTRGSGAAQPVTPVAQPVNAGATDSKPVTPQPVTPQPVDPVAEDGKKMGLADIIMALNPYHKPSQEEIEKQRKKEKRDKTFAAIGDTISSLANLYFTGKGAPNMYNQDKSMTARTQAMWDKINADRQKNDLGYANFAIMALKEQQSADKDDRDWRYRLTRDKVQDDLSEKQLQERKEQREHEWQRQEEEKKERQKTREENNAYRQQEFEEKKRQFNASLQLQRETAKDRNEALDSRNRGSRRTKAESEQSYMLGGKMYNFPSSVINALNLEQVLKSGLSEEAYNEAIYEQAVDSRKKPIYEYERGDDGKMRKKPRMVKRKLSVEDLLHIIGQHIGEPGVQKEVMKLGGYTDGDADDEDFSKYEVDGDGDGSDEEDDFSEFEVE